ncbi:MAG: hypothetical protein HYZ45_07145 [Burkholderiales bacterium]|nr:hypothetical protein [Burkholderiales bacterium]
MENFELNMIESTQAANGLTLRVTSLRTLNDEEMTVVAGGVSCTCGCCTPAWTDECDF